MIPWYFLLIALFLGMAIGGTFFYTLGHSNGCIETANAVNVYGPKVPECVHLWGQWTKVLLEKEQVSRDFHGGVVGTAIIKVDGVERVCDSCGDVQRKVLEYKEIGPSAPKRLKDNGIEFFQQIRKELR